MLRRSGGRRRAQLDEEEDERVVYYDLDAGSHSRNLLLSPDAAAAPAQPRASAVNEADGSHIFPRQQQPLFNLDDSADEAEEKEQQEQENPFATLIQQQQTHKPAATERTSTRSQAGGRANSFLQVDTRTEDAGRRPAATSSNAVGRSILKRSQPHNGVATTRGVNKKLSFEAADSRPARWSTQKPSAADTKNRRKSLSAIQKRRSQLEAASAKRRKSMSPTLSGPSTTQSVEESRDGSRPAPKRRLLSDVLQRATLLSQQSTGNDESALSHSQTADPTDGDAILDTEHQMRAEPFAPQIFSPSKPAPAAGTKHSWKSKSDGLVSKLSR
ncbi:uncharacterized protein IUM83_08166 [Phytophthora cinnamomi]|uniref:uncharacterized protein n=1 Tax=Phytophthora cinnamomi TaxID=4785 RepID=UPI00355ABCE9|nr:hypothetical protein IUM83_08166 [Phytophthora cinnamomi]